MQTANLVSQWNKFSSLDCVTSNSSANRHNSIQWEFFFLFFIEFCEVHSNGTDLATSFTTLYTGKNNKRSDDFQTKSDERSMKWTQIDCGKPRVRLIDFWWYHFVNIQRQCGEKFHFDCANYHVMLEFFFRRIFLFCFWPKSSSWNRFIFVLESDSLMNYLSTSFLFLFRIAESFLSGFMHWKINFEPQCWKCCDSRLFILVYRIPTCVCLCVCVYHWMSLITMAACTRRWMANVNNMRAYMQ